MQAFATRLAACASAACVWNNTFDELAASWPWWLPDSMPLATWQRPRSLDINIGFLGFYGVSGNGTCAFKWARPYSNYSTRGYLTGKTVHSLIAEHNRTRKTPRATCPPRRLPSLLAALSM